jgi:solute carrier family 25 protein 14/30
MQVQGRGEHVAAADRKYRNVVQGLRVMLRDDGIRGWFFAWRPSVARAMWYSGLRFGLYEPIKRKMGADAHTAPLHLKVAAAMGSGTIAASLSNPLDIVNVRYQSATGAEYRALPPAWRMLQRIALVEGPRGLARGYWANTVRAAAITGAQVGGYDHIKHMLLASGALPEGPALHLVTAVSASVVAIAVTNPMDVVKTRMMNPRAECDNGIHRCVAAIACGEGAAAFYKGATMAWLRLGPHTVVTFTVLERLRHLAGVAPI